MSDFRKVEDQRYINTLFAGIAKQKEVPIALHYNNRQLYARLTVAAKTKQTFTIVPGGDLPVAREENVRISLFYKEIFFIFESEVGAIHEDSFEIRVPDKVYASYRRLVNRYKPKNTEEATIGQFGTDQKFHLVDISTQGLAFIADDRCFEENETVRNMVIRFAGGPEICLDAIVKHVTKRSEDKYFYGLAILSIEWHAYQKLFKYIFESSYPYFRLFETFSGDQIMKLYEEARFLHLKTRDGEDDLFLESIHDLDQVKDKPLIASNLVYQKNNKLIAVGSALRVYNRTFLGKPLMMMEQVRLNPKAKTDIYIGLADYLLSHPYFQNYLAYIDEDYEWHHEILTNAAEIVNDPGKFHYETVCLLEFRMDSNRLRFNTSKSVANGSLNYVCQLLEKPDEAFFEFCRENLIRLEVENYGLDPGQFTLDELSQIYQAYGFDLARKLWRIGRDDKTIGYALAECYSDVLSRSGNADSCKLFFADENVDTEKVVKELLPQLELFYGVRRKNGFSLICGMDWGANASLDIPGLTQKRIGKVLMNREGLSEYKKLLLANFEYYSKYFPLTYPQKGIWYLEKMYPGTSIGVIAASVRVKENLDFELLEQAVNMVLKSNDGLRIRIIDENGIPKQYFSEFQYKKLEYYDFSQKKPKELFDWEEKNTKIPFPQLINSDLIYFALVRFNDKDCGFYVKNHHLISDAWTTTNIISTQIMTCYYQLWNNKKYVLESQPSYIDFILSEDEYKFSDKFEKDRNFWKNKIETIPELIYLKPRNQNALINTSTIRKTFLIDKEFACKITGFCHQYKVSPQIVFMAMLLVYLHRTTQLNDIVIGTPILNRLNAKEKATAGMFISPIPVRVWVDGNYDMVSFIQELSKDWLQLLKHQKFPYELLLNEFRKQHKIADNLYDITVSFQNAKLNFGEYFEEYRGRWFFCGHQVETLNIHISDYEDEGVFVINFDYKEELLTDSDITSIFDHFTNIFNDAISNPSKKILELEILSPIEKQKLLYNFNNTNLNYPKDKTIDQLFEEQVYRTPDNIAIVYKDKKLTYSELDEKAKQVVRYLVIEKNIRSNALIGILIENSIEQVIAILGVLKAGCAFVPIEPEIPVERIKTIISDASIEIIISCERNIHLLNDLKEKSISFHSYFCVDNMYDSQDTITDLMLTKGVLQSANSNNIAYVIYTSGSTGVPKGVLIRHFSLVNMSFWHNSYFGVTSDDRATRYASFGFDASIAELFPYLIIGASIYIIEKEIRLDCRLVNDYYHKNQITIGFLPTQFYEQFCEMENNSLRVLLTAGDKLKYFKQNKYQLVNNYGPTEYTVVTTCIPINHGDKQIPIGKPIANTNVYILDKYDNLLPIGVPGELCISGDGLALGYLNRPELTSEKFVINPFTPGEKMYRSGDLACWRLDGNIEFLGRIDNQVKIRGNRIELQEIEIAILKNQDIKDVVVLYKERKDLSQYLCAYIVSDIPLVFSELRENLSKELPSYMLPSYFVLLEKFPLTPNGKIDKKALPDPNERTIKKEYKLPRNETEKVLYEFWKEVLDIDNIGITDDFFELGGDSLSLMRIHTMIYSKGWKLSFQDFYKYRTIAELAKALDINVKKLENPELKITEKNTGFFQETQKIVNNREIKNDQNIFLTGATGFLGIHLLDELLTKTQAIIYCLIRANDKEHAERRLVEIFDYYLLYEHQKQIGKRIIIINGDLNLNQFGLSDDEYHQLGARIEFIIHSAALVKHFGDYQNFKRINVDGTKNLINFALQFQRELNYISTMSIANSSRSNNSGFEYFSENDINIGQAYQDNVYIKSKYEAENEVFKAINNGLKVTVFRVGNLTARYKDGKFQINAKQNMFYNIIKSIMEIGFIPEYLVENYLEFTPVDLCSQAIVKLIMANVSNYSLFHVFNHNYIQFKDFFNILNDLDVRIDQVSCSLEEYFNIVMTQNKKPDALNFLIYYFEQNMFNNRYEISSEITFEYLKDLGFQWPMIDKEYVAKVLNHNSPLVRF